MPTIQNLHKIYIHQLETIIKESELLLQRDGGLDGELHTSGWICEQFVRSTLETMCLPSQFRLTSGYIATPSLLSGAENLPQCDLLIVDKQFPPLFRFRDTEIEVVPRQSVCGIIEIKRTLTQNSLCNAAARTGALPHLEKIIEALEETTSLKTDQILNSFNRHLGFHNHSSDKPLIGVIALQNGIANFAKDVPKAIKSTNSLVDFIWTLDGHAVLPAFQTSEETTLYSHVARPVTKEWSSIAAEEFTGAESDFYRRFSGTPCWELLEETEANKAEVFARMIGVLSIMLSRTFGRPMRETEINGYFFSSY